MSALLQHLATLARYHEWATQRLVNEHVALLSDEQYHRDCGLFFKSVHGTLNHLIVGEGMLWFRRFAEGVSQPASPDFSLSAVVESDRDAVRQRLADQAARWQPFIAGLTRERLEGTLNYTTMSGLATSLPFASTLAHVFNHATHHRGQVTAALTMMGRECPEIDMVYFLQMESRK